MLQHHVQQRRNLVVAAWVGVMAPAVGFAAEAPASSEPAASPVAAAESRDDAPRDVNPWQGHVLDGTGLLLPRGRVQVGLYEAGYGIFDWLGVGTSPYLWILGPVLEGFAGNFSAKAGFGSDRLALSLELRYIFVNVRDQEDDDSASEARVEAHVVPMTAGFTFIPDRVQAYSLGFRYTIVEGTGATRQEQEAAGGTATVDAAHLIVHGRWRITKVFGLYARGYFEPWNANLNVDAEAEQGGTTQVTLRASVDPDEGEGLKWSAVAGVHLVLGGANVRFGGGYGDFFVPTTGLVVPTQSFVPDFDIYVRF